MNLFEKLLTLILNLKEREREKRKESFQLPCVWKSKKILHAHLNWRR